jgi:hypothetical protein
MDPEASTANTIHTDKGIGSRDCLSFIASPNPAKVSKPEVWERASVAMSQGCSLDSAALSRLRLARYSLRARCVSP